MRTRNNGRRGSPLRILPVCLIVGLLAAACSTAPSTTNSTSHTSSKRGTTFTFAISAQPTLNPYTADPNPYDIWVLELAYAPLIEQVSVGNTVSYVGGLAQSFKYTDTHNEIFQMALRPNVKFADGSPVTAKAVVASLNYFLKAGINAHTWGATISSVKATGPLTVQVTNTQPNPDMPFVFSQSALSGLIISPAGLAHPSNLGQATYGAGQYVLDTSQSVTNSHYVFTPNKNYWDQSAIHWNKVVALEIADPTSSVQALKAGQVEFIGSAVNLLPEIKAAGLPYYAASAGIVGVTLADRDGTVAPELKNPLVREALNYAIDRKAILSAIFGGYGDTTDQLNSPGFEGYNAAVNNEYPYDPSKAMQLLSQAGYPHGFTISMLAEDFIGENVLAQAIAGQWQKIGVTVNLTTDAQIPQLIGDEMSKKFAVVPLVVLNSTAYLLSTTYMLPIPNPANPFASGDPELSALLAQAAGTADPTSRSSAYEKAIARVVSLGWFAPVATIDGVFAGSTKVVGWQNSGNVLDVTNIRPA